MKVLCLLFLVVGLTGCATYNTATGRNEIIFVSTSSEVQMGKAAHSQIIAKTKVITDADSARRIENIGRRLARISDRQDFQYHFILLDSDELNAFTVPGGYVYFYNGLYKQLGSDDEIAAVLAHEIGHCAAKHTVKKFQGALGYNVARNVVLNILAMKIPGVQSIAGLGADQVMNLAVTAYSRQDEYEADQLGIKYLYLAGFDLNGMIKVFEVLEANTKKDHMPLILRTHHFLKDRIGAAKKEIAAVKGKY